MKNLKTLSFNLLSLTIIMLTAGAVIVRQASHSRGNETSVRENARKFTVKIFSDEGGSGKTKIGSGVIIERIGSEYIVLTNCHVIGNIDDESKKCQHNPPNLADIKTYDGEAHNVTYIKPLHGADLAIVYFRSPKRYQVAEINSQIDDYQKGSLYGIPGYENNMNNPFFIYNHSISRYNPNLTRSGDVCLGGQLAIEALTPQGVSGSSVLNEESEVVGITCSGARDGRETYAIPIQIAVELAEKEELLIRWTEDKYLHYNDNFQQLYNLLEKQQWRQADLQTRKLMLDIVNKKEKKHLFDEDIKQLRCGELQEIDRFWSHFSGGKFGLGVKKEIWRHVGGKLGVPDINIYKKFEKELGWYRRGRRQDPIYNLKDAPRGHLPSYKVVNGAIWSILLAELNKCPSQARN